MTLDSKKLTALLGSEEAAQRFLAMFREQWPEQLTTLKQALASGDWSVAEQTAHALKSQCRYVGLDTLADILQAIEQRPSAVHDLSLFPLSF